MIITNFHLYLIQLWCQFFQIFVYGYVVYTQTWEVSTLKNCIEHRGKIANALLASPFLWKGLIQKPTSGLRKMAIANS